MLKSFTSSRTGSAPSSKLKDVHFDIFATFTCAAWRGTLCGGLGSVDALVEPTSTPNRSHRERGGGGEGGQGCVRREGGGVWNPNGCVPNMVQINISFYKFRFSHYEIWVHGRPMVDIAPPPPPPCVAFRRVVVPLRGPGQSPVLPSACCAGSLRSVGRCGRCSRWCRFRGRGAQ